MELAALLAADDDAANAAAALARSPDVQSAPSDRRFDMVLAALRRRRAATAPGGSEGVPCALVLAPGGEAVIKLEPLAAGTRLTVLEQAAPGLSAFLVARLPALLAEFRRDQRRPSPDRAEDDRAS
jgi:ParB family chromosome partitioning protein